MAVTATHHFSFSLSESTTRRELGLSQPIETTISGAFGHGPGYLLIGFAASEEISFGDITPGWCVVKNLGDDSVEIGPYVGGVLVPFIEVPPGCSFPFYFASGVTVHAQATGSSAVGIQIDALNR